MVARLSKDDMLDVLWSKEEIRALAFRYCRGADRGDMALLEEIYHPGALDEHGFNKSNTARDFLDAVPAMRASMGEIQHNITNHLIEVDGDQGEGELYVIAYHRYQSSEGEVVFVTGGRFLDKYERRDGEWRILHRMCVDDWGIKMPAPEKATMELLDGGLTPGRLGTGDPSYHFFRLLAKTQ